MRDSLYILYQFNEKYAPYAGVSMTSLFENNKAAESIYIYILGENLSEESCNRFRATADKYNREVIFVNTDRLVETMKDLNMPTYRGSYAANMRLFVNEIVDAIGQGDMPKRLIYLDADTIVTGDLTEMYYSQIKTLGMVYDALGCEHKYDLGFDSSDGYYNSGVILYDMSRWQQGDYTNKIIDHVRNVRAQYPSPDQDLINVVLRGEITPLGIECNYQPHLRDYSYSKFMKAFSPSPFYSEEEIAKADLRPTILHAYRYVGEFAWHKNNVHPFNDEFDKYLNISAWKDYIKEPADGGMVMLVEKLMYKCLPKSIFLGIFKIMHKSFYKKAERLSRSNRISSAM